MRPTSYLGLDIGSTSIKLVELRATAGVPELATYGMATVPTLPATRQYDAGQLAATVASLLKQSRATARGVYSALPTESVFTSIITVPQGNAKAVAAAVHTEAAKLLPRPIDEMVLDPQQLGVSADKHSVRILLVAAPRDLVERYDTICRLAGIELLGLEVESFAMVRSLVGKDPASIAVVDFGAATTDIIVVANGVPVLTRSVRIGGRDLTNALQSVLGVEVTLAEQAKRDAGLSAGNVGLAGVYKKIIEPVVHELRYTLDTYFEQSQRRVEKIILTGGSSSLTGLSEYIGTETGARTFVGNPWSRVRYPLELEKVLGETAGQFSVAIGLALRPFKS